MKSALTQQHLHVVLVGKEKKPATMTDEEWDVLDELARGAIKNYITDEMLINRMEVNSSMEDKALMLLTSLPPSYKHFWTTLMFGKVTLDFEYVVQDIMSHQRMNQRSGENSQGEGLVAKTGERGR
ncbi:unnamed protein product [Prunus brigantina]